MKIKTFKIAFLFFIFMAKNCLALEVITNKNALRYGETFVLTIEVDGGGDVPDLSALSSDFDIMGTSSSSQTNIINGKVTSSRTWNLTLMPKREGELEIPSFKAGADTSKPIKITVSNQETQAHAVEKFFIKADIDNNSPFVQQQVLYTVKIYDSVGLVKIMPEVPNVKDLQFIKLGDYSKTDENINGVRYDVYVFKYAVFPQVSGEVKIPSLFADVITQENAGDSLFDYFNKSFGSLALQIPDVLGTSKTTRIVSNSLKLSVKAKPEEVKGFWTPAKQVGLNDAWKPNPPIFREGEPISRIVAVSGYGVLPEQLPDFAKGEISGVRVYEDKASSEITEDLDTVVSLKQKTLVYIPERAGKTVIPEITVSWWDTVNNQLKKAVLPEMTVDVLPAEGNNQQPPTDNKTTTLDADEKTDVDKTAILKEDLIENLIEKKPSKTPTFLIVLYVVSGGILGFLIALIILKTKSKKKQAKVTSNLVHTNNEKQLLTKFEKACDLNDAKTASEAMLEWAKIKWQNAPPPYIKDLAERLGDEELKKQIINLDRKLYMGGDFSTLELKKAFLGALKKYKGLETDKAKVIPDLYP